MYVCILAVCYKNRSILNHIHRYCFSCYIVLQIYIEPYTSVLFFVLYRPTDAYFVLILCYIIFECSNPLTDMTCCIFLFFIVYLHLFICFVWVYLLYWFGKAPSVTFWVVCVFLPINVNIQIKIKSLLCVCVCVCDAQVLVRRAVVSCAYSTTITSRRTLLSSIRPSCLGSYARTCTRSR